MLLISELSCSSDRETPQDLFFKLLQFILFLSHTSILILVRTTTCFLHAMVNDFKQLILTIHLNLHISFYE